MEDEDEEQFMNNFLAYMIENEINSLTVQIDKFSYSIIINDKPKISELLSHLTPYTKIRGDDHILSGEQCSICFNHFSIGEYKRTLDKCNHTFHKKCIDKWFNKNKNNMNCPVCRTNYNRLKCETKIQLDGDESDSTIIII